jgi:protein-L-isoaspartate(D-aspartate) O-methyltransferase
MDDAVRAAFAAVPRAGFLPRTERWRADFDGPIPIGHGQTNSQPRTVATMLTLLDVRPGQRVLDIGSGSGWTTALLGHLVGPTGMVLGLELEPDLAVWGAVNLSRAGAPQASIRVAERGVLGAPAEGPWDRILVSANAKTLPQALVDQLTPEGVMVIPVRGRMTRAVLEAGAARTTQHGPYLFVPLR